jgi:hypothetical protein
MSALEIIEQIRRLPTGEQEKIRAFVRENLEDGQLSSQELGELTERMVEAQDSAKAERLKEEIVRGFYGNAPHA